MNVPWDVNPYLSYHTKRIEAFLLHIKNVYGCYKFFKIFCDNKLQVSSMHLCNHYSVLSISEYKNISFLRLMTQIKPKWTSHHWPEQWLYH